MTRAQHFPKKRSTIDADHRDVTPTIHEHFSDQLIDLSTVEKRQNETNSGVW